MNEINTNTNNIENDNSSTPGNYFPSSSPDSSEKSIKSCYAVVYVLENRKWVVAGEGGWSEVHLCQDHMDNSCRILAWTVTSQQVLMNCNVVSNCVYKTKSKNFHSFKDENGQRFGLGFHKSDSGLVQASEFLSSVTEIIAYCKLLETTIEQQSLEEQNSPKAHVPKTSIEQFSSNEFPVKSGGLPKLQYSDEEVHKDVQQTPESYSQRPKPFSGGTEFRLRNSIPTNNSNSNIRSAINNSNSNIAKGIANVAIALDEYKEELPDDGLLMPDGKPKERLSPVSEALKGFDNAIQEMPCLNLQPTYHLNAQTVQSLPKQPVSHSLGNLRILPPKPKKLQSGDSNIKNPNKVERLWRVTFDKKTGQYTGLPQEWMDALNMQFGIIPKLLPSVKLNKYTANIPKILIQLYSSLKKRNAFEQVGIFRLAPNANANNAMKDKINKGQMSDDEENIDINVCANLIKVWFRDLPVPLLSCVKPMHIEMVSDMEDAVDVLMKFPEPEQSIFLWLCDMCVDIANYEKVNKMSAQNLAIVIGPNLFNTETFENPMKAMTYSQKVVEFFKHCILWRASL